MHRKGHETSRFFGIDLGHWSFHRYLMENGPKLDPKNAGFDYQNLYCSTACSEQRLWNAFWSPFGSLLAPFWLPLASFWRPLAPFWFPFGSFWHPPAHFLLPSDAFSIHFVPHGTITVRFGSCGMRRIFSILSKNSLLYFYVLPFEMGVLCFIQQQQQQELNPTKYQKTATRQSAWLALERWPEVN